MTRKFFISIPALLEAKQVKQMTFIFSAVYDGEINKLTTAFDRDVEDRFYILSLLEIPAKNKKKLEHIKSLLGILNKAHKKDKLSAMELEALKADVYEIDKVSYPDIQLTAAQAVDQYWS